MSVKGNEYSTLQYVWRSNMQPSDFILRKQYILRVMKTTEKMYPRQKKKEREKIMI